MTLNQACDYAIAYARARSLTYDVVAVRRAMDGYDAYPRYYDAKPRTDKGVVVATYRALE